MSDILSPEPIDETRDTVALSLLFKASYDEDWTPKRHENSQGGRANFYPSKTSEIVRQAIKLGWSRRRLMETADEFALRVERGYFSVAQFMKFPPADALYPQAWYFEQIGQYGPTVNDQLECYRVQGEIRWRYRDGQELPFEKVWPLPATKPVPAEPLATPEEIAQTKKLIHDAIEESVKESERRAATERGEGDAPAAFVGDRKIGFRGHDDKRTSSADSSV